MTRPRATKVERLAYLLSEVSEMTGLSVRSLRRQGRLNRLRLTRIGPRTTVVLAEDLVSWLHSRSITGE